MISQISQSLPWADIAPAISLFGVIVVLLLSTQFVTKKEHEKLRAHDKANMAQYALKTDHDIQALDNDVVQMHEKVSLHAQVLEGIVSLHLKLDRVLQIQNDMDRRVAVLEERNRV